MANDHKPQFFTATILQWKPLLSDDHYKDIMIESLRFLEKTGSVVIYAFVIMPNHIHLIWRIQDGYTRESIQLRFLKFTAQQIKFRMLDSGNQMLDQFSVSAKDRKYQFWERNSLSTDLWSHNVFIQKLDYIHNNPLQEKWRLVESAETYRYSSANFYLNGIDEFGILTRHDE